MKKINIKSIEKLAAAIKEAEGRATARTITAENIVYTLDRIRVPKSRLDGTVVRYDGGEKFPHAYKWIPESTHWEAENRRGVWYVTNIWRGTCPNSTKSGYITYGESAKAWIIENASAL